MRAFLVATVLAVLLAGCGGEAPGPESVLREWSDALNSGDYARAGSLFAPGAEVVQGDRLVVLESAEEAARWAASLPCRGRIVRAEEDGASVEASFVLRNRPDRPCDAPGAVARVLVRVADGKIVLWHQLGGDGEDSGQVI